jgi:hypothetical protein
MVRWKEPWKEHWTDTKRGYQKEQKMDTLKVVQKKLQGTHHWRVRHGQ